MKNYYGTDCRKNKEAMEFIHETSWRVEEVMDYFGEYIRDERDAIELMMESRRRRGKGIRVSYTQAMNTVRELLIERGSEVAFILGYRRTKDGKR